MRRSRIPRTLARRIDRLSRAAHRFHRYAHHPLCDRYAGEVVRLGHSRVRICRGCAAAACGGAAGGVVGLAVGIPVAIVATALGAALILATLYARTRTSKLLSRAAPAALFTLAMVAGARMLTPLGLATAGVAAAIVGGLRVLYGQRGADRTPCASCPERTASPCSGFVAIVSRERAFQRVSQQWLTRSRTG